MKINKFNFENIADLKKVLKMPINKLKYVCPRELGEIIRKIKKIVTVHLYPFSYSNRKEKCLLDLQRWSYHQIYLFVYKNQIYWTFGHGDTSQSRSNHNNLLEIFLKNPKARKKVITAIIAVNNGNVISYYFYDGFAYSNNDIGSNWNREIINNLKKSKLPYSEVYSDISSPTKSLFFINQKIEIEIYRQIEEDISIRKFNLYLEKLSKKKKFR